MPYVERAGQPTLYYEIDDHTDPWSDAPCIVLLHGFGRSSRYWYSWVPYLSRFYRVVRPDMRGFGRSTQGFERSQQFELADLAADVIAVIDAVGASSAHVCGEHFGGTLAMQIAAYFPDAVRTLASVAGPVILQEDVQGEFALGEPTWEAALRKHGVRTWAEVTNARSRFPPDTSAKFLSWYSNELAKNDLETLIRFSKLCTSYDMTACLPRISAPVLGLYARSRQAQAELLREHVKHFTGIQIETDYFMFYPIQPRLCAETVLHFAAQHDGRVCNES